jgi:hypothetical protein
MKFYRFMTVPVYLSLVTVYGAMAGTPCNSIDAVTSASQMLEIKGGQACATSASVTWNDQYSDGSQQILKYGTTTSYGKVINLLPFTENTDITTTIPNLTSNTQYFAQFYRVYEGEVSSTNFKFLTSGNNAVRDNTRNSSVQLPSIRVGSAVIALDVKEGTAVGISLYSLSGERIVSRNAVTGNTIDFAKIVPAGVYLCKVTTMSGTIARAAVIGQ